MACRVDVRAHSRRCPPKQKELPLCARAGESSKLGQKRCLKRTVANMLRVVPGCKGRR